MASSPKQPKPIDPNVAAEAQARWNRTGVINPMTGSVQWEGNNQVVKPSDDMMALFGQAQNMASTGGERYQAPEAMGSIRDQVMARLQANQYQPGSQQGPTADMLSKPADTTSLAKGTPFRDAFFGEKGPDGSRHTLRHIATGGLAGAIPRGFMNLIDERRGRNDLPGPVGVGDMGGPAIERNGLGPLLSGMGTGPSRPARGMPGPVPLDPIAPSPIGRNNSKPGKPGKNPMGLSPVRGLGRKPTAREAAAMRRDPNSLAYAGNNADAMSPLFTSQTAGLFNAYDLNNSPGAAFDAAVAAARAAQRPNRNIQQ